ncbi:MAG TPA: restriction endonuclease [Chloroflexota bacterium]|nr:restriction endonuclease [Chloroflexota bacterium]
MGLTQSQRAMIEKARSVGAGLQGVAMSDHDCSFLVATIVADLGLGSHFPELPATVVPFFDYDARARSVLPTDRFSDQFERLVTLDPNADTYFACLSALLKSRLKYQRILETQPIPTLDQVGPRGLLQFGTLASRALAALLLWRKWLFDIDNRAGQETGYLFEPIICSAIGGVSIGPSRSPVHRRQDPTSGRQVDCVRDARAYEIKLRVTIAASGQGRWQEQLDFPLDCKSSGYRPILLVLDPTPNDKLDELKRAFVAQGGQAHVGPEAWKHLESLAGTTMSIFLRKYVRDPMTALLAADQGEAGNLPDLTLRLSASEFVASLSGETLWVPRAPPGQSAAPGAAPPDDDDEEAPHP